MINQILEVLKPYIWSVEETGSCILPYIKNSHDRDIIIITKTWEDRAAARKLYHSTFSLEERQQLKKRDNIDIIFNVYPDIIEHQIFFYLKHYIKPLEGYEKLSIEEDINIERYKSLLINFLPSVKMRENYENLKVWYHIYTVMCIIKHNSYDLTIEEQRNINILHDRKPEENNTRILLINNIIEEIEKWER